MARNTTREQRPLAAELSDSAPEFRDSLIVRLEISSVISPRPVLLSGHDLRHFDLDLRDTGFSGELCVEVSDDVALQSVDRDLLIAMFRAPDLLKLRLTLEALRVDQDINVVPPPLEINALVSERALSEHVERLGNAPLSFRRYYFRFADAAQVLWRQHFPCELYTQKSLRQVIDAHRTTHIAIEYLDAEVGQIRPMIFLGCDAEHRGSERASFYDLLMWRLAETERSWSYDYASGVYEVAKVKLPPTAVSVTASDIEEIYTYYPAPPRAAEALLDDYTEQPQNREVPATAELLQKNLVAGVRSDFLFNTPIATEFDQEIQRRSESFTLPGPEFVLQYRQFPSSPIIPGAGVDFAAGLINFQTEAIAVPVEALAELCRVFRISISGESAERDVRPVYDGKVPGRFACRVHIWLEAASNPDQRRPPYILPKYPVHIEGKIFSEVGGDLEETYQFYPDPATNISQYKVKIPLWREQVISVPYNPNMDPGHFYFPAYKNERVLIAFYYDRAYLKRFLDWRPSAQLPLETQGDQLLLGKTPMNRTAVRHIYQNELPVFEIERLNMLQSFDTELVQLSEGSLLLQVGTPLGAPPAAAANVPPPPPPSAGTTDSSRKGG